MTLHEKRDVMDRTKGLETVLHLLELCHQRGFFTLQGLNLLLISLPKPIKVFNLLLLFLNQLLQKFNHGQRCTSCDLVNG